MLCCPDTTRRATACSHAEDEGVVLAVLVQADGTTALAVLDGATLEEVAVAELPSLRLTVGFHGCFLPAAA